MLDLECEDDHQENCPAVDGSHPRALTPHLPSPGVYVCLTSDIVTGQNVASLPANYAVKCNWFL